MLTPDACIALKKMGYPQDEVDHKWTLAPDLESPDSGGWLHLHSIGRFFPATEEAACPSEVEALDYLAEKFNIALGISISASGFLASFKTFDPESLAWSHDMPYAPTQSASELIKAIHAHFTQAQAAH